MFEDFQSVWRREGLLKEALEMTGKMLEENREMFRAVIDALMDRKEMKVDIYKEDQEVNRYEMEIRKKILEHLSINPKQDVIFSLVLLGVARDVERTGDFSKNIYELSLKHAERMEGGKYDGELRRMKDQILEMFDLTRSAFDQSIVEKAERVMGMHHNDISKTVNRMVDEILDDEEMNAKEAVTRALLSRYMKRISAHLANIASSVSNPFQRIRYVKGAGYVDL